MGFLVVLYRFCLSQSTKVGLNPTDANSAGGALAIVGVIFVGTGLGSACYFIAGRATEGSLETTIAGVNSAEAIMGGAIALAAVFGIMYATGCHQKCCNANAAVLGSK